MGNDDAGPASDLRMRAGDAYRRARDQRPWLTATVVWGVPVVVLVALIALSRVQPVEVFVLGLQTGGVYALVALGVALVYKATNVLNFAQGEFGTVPAFVAYIIMVGSEGFGDITVQPDTDLLWIGTIAAILTGAVLGVLTNVLVVQRLAQASETIALVATGGVALMFTAAEVLIFQAQPREFPRFKTGNVCIGSEAADPGAFALCPLTIGNIPIPWHTVIVLGVLAIASIVLAVFFQSRRGVALLATAQEPFAAELQGVSVRGMATLAWGAAGAFGAVAGLLGAGNFTNLTPGLMTTTFLIPGFVGALLGGINSMAGAVVGGLLIGITVSFANTAILAYNLSGVLPGPPSIATLVVLLAVLLFRPRGLLGKEA